MSQIATTRPNSPPETPTADSVANGGITSAPPHVETPRQNPVSGATLSVGEYYWGYGSGVVVTKVPGWGEFVIADRPRIGTSEAYKDAYRQRTATERINSQAVALGIERPHLRNGRAITNRNTLIYVLINLRFLQRIRARLDLRFFVPRA